MHDTAIQTHFLKSFPYNDKGNIHKNWEEGRYKRFKYFYHKKIFTLKLHLDPDKLYFTYDKSLLVCKRSKYSEPLEEKRTEKIISNTRTPITDFVKKDQTIFGTCLDGKCFIHENETVSTQHLHSKKDAMQCVDFAKNIYGTSSESITQLWRRRENFEIIHLDLMSTLRDSYKVIRFTDDAQHFFGGLSLDINDSALREVNVETSQEFILNSATVSLYDLKLKDENVIFTVNFEPTCRMYDRRANMDVASWNDPRNSEFYCLQYDGLYTVLCGTKYGGRVNLYDIRLSKKCVQSYSPGPENQSHSLPIYNIAFNSRYLFVPDENYLNVLDFDTSTVS